ncbi:syndecan-3-like [Sebastes umbrosus]|uniref:syndecan-3-like n=1 Tax=Sebastes umbrosus TaxID=72105 RepID=UPI00189CF1CB|nr:syndecan-3-like [Sebastes umbrosus]
MRNSLTACLFLTLLLINSVSVSFRGPPEDLEASGSELDSSGSGSGDLSEQGGMKKDQPNSKDVRIITANSGTKNTFHDSSVLNFDKDGKSGFIVVANSKSFLERKEIFAAVVAGGVVGAALAIALAGLLIYTWQKKDNVGYV